jgi:hypothetical protein
MTDEQRDEEGEEEAIEDLDAPADAQANVAGGEGCGKPSLICAEPTCSVSHAACFPKSPTNIVVVWEQG